VGLNQYRQKRRFKRTPEPSGSATVKPGHRFVVQKHDATHLHYDFRLELDGTLKSWAVPKGPSLDPGQKRLAVQVEDHPIEYADFEGTIPQGEYGGGTVMVWDRGSWIPEGEDDPQTQYREGRLKFTLEGQKLHGSWALVRTARGDARKPQWLLIKHRDSAAKPEAKHEIIETETKSAKTGRSLEEIAQGAPASKNGRRGSKKTGTPDVWHSNRPARGANRVQPEPAKAASSSKRVAVKTISLDKLPGAKQRAMPGKPKAELATLVQEPPATDAWLHEIKFDGYRMFCCVKNGKVRFISRSGQDWTGRMGSLADVASKLPVDSAVLDGEVVVLDGNGVSQFQLLQNALGKNKPGNEGQKSQGAPLLYYAFDLIYLNQFDLTGVVLETRKKQLESLLKHAQLGSRIQLSEHVVGNGRPFYRQAARAQLEGIVSKKRGSLYIAGRGSDWAKSKCRQTEEFVIGGYTKPEGTRVGFGALLMGYFRGNRELIYAGRVGTGFSTKFLRELTVRLKQLEQKQSPFAGLIADIPRKGVHWVRPQLVGQVEFSNWTDEGLLRQAAFQGLREDKPAREVVLERPAPTTG
jgi:bifunctional non-homologous end joining protein LigD